VVAAVVAEMTVLQEVQLVSTVGVAEAVKTVVEPVRLACV
jgi:hypothetical protein